MNNIVSFELAKLLKEKWFDVPCNFYYYEGMANLKSQKTKHHKGRLLNRNIYQNQYSAPTIADVVMWLNDTYGIWIDSSCDVDGNFYPKISFSKEENWFNLELRSKMNAGNREIIIVDYKSPTLAYEAAILYTLTNLI